MNGWLDTTVHVLQLVHVLSPVECPHNAAVELRDRNLTAAPSVSAGVTSFCAFLLPRPPASGPSVVQPEVTGLAELDATPADSSGDDGGLWLE